MTDPAALLALAAVVEGGIGPDREIDARVFCALHSNAEPMMKPGYVARSKPGLGPPEETEPYTASVDAALALLQEVLPGRKLHVDEYLDGSGFAVRLSSVDKDGWPLKTHRGLAPTLPRAIVAATLRAVAGRAEG